MSRTIKIRALENAVYSMDYNRMRFQISPDEMSTDLSESYLAFKLFVVNGLTKQPFTQTEILNLTKAHIQFSFGDKDGESYSSACLIKTARLFSMAGEMTLLEEINYSNVLSQYLHQVQNDFETLASDSMMSMTSTGSLMGGSIASTCSSYFGTELSLGDQSVQVNIKLSELFGLCKSNNFWLSQTNGLQIELELEPTKTLIQQRVCSDLMPPLPKLLSGSLGAPEDYSSNSKTIRCAGQNLFSTSSQEIASLVGKIEKPISYVYDANTYIDHIFQGTLIDTLDLTPAKNYKIASLGALSIAEWDGMGAFAAADGPDVDTSAVVQGIFYTIKAVGTLSILEWAEVGAVSLGAPIDTDAIADGTTYQVLDPGVAALSLLQWQNMGWTETYLPSVGSSFIGNLVGVAVTGGSVGVLSMPAVNSQFTCSNPITSNATGIVYIQGTQFVGQQFLCVLSGAGLVTGGECYLVTPNGTAVNDAGNRSNTIFLKSSLNWTLTNMETLGLSVGRNLITNWRITQANKTPKFFKHTSVIASMVAHNGMVGASIQLQDTYAYPLFQGTSLSGAIVKLDSFEILTLGLGEQSTANYNFPIAKYVELSTTSTILMSDSQLMPLQLAGILSGGSPTQIADGSIKHLTGSNVMFSLGISMNEATDHVSIYPDYYENPDSSSMVKLFSNQTKSIPVQGGLCRVLSAERVGTEWLVKFDNLGLTHDNSIQAINLLCPGLPGGAITAGLGIKVPATSFYMRFSNCKVPDPQDAIQMIVGEWYMIVEKGTATDAQWAATGNKTPSDKFDTFQCIHPMDGTGLGVVSWLQPNTSALTYMPKTFQITKAELVLFQNMKNVKMPPAQIYSTFKVEAVTIESGQLTEYQRQFLVTEPNCFSVLLLTPEYSGNGDSLISHSRNIETYRWSVNNIDNTNRNITIKSNYSSYPSSLHYDKYIDCMTNDISQLKTLTGINGVARSVDAPVCFPLKIYTASDAESSYLNPLSGYTLQFSCFSDQTHQKYITTGTIFLFKACFKVL